MKPLTLVVLLGLFLALPACRMQNPYPPAPGTLFIRQQICDLGDFKAGFFRPANALKAHGFQAYRFYRDRHDPKTYLLVFTCANLQEAVGFLQNSNFTFSCVGAGLGLPLMWAGVGVDGPPDAAPAPALRPPAEGESRLVALGRSNGQRVGVPVQRPKVHEGPNGDRLKGLRVTRLEVGNDEAWKKTWDVEGAGKGTGFRFYRLESRPHVVVETQEVPDILKLAEPPLSGGATYRETWLGTFLESGTF